MTIENSNAKFSPIDLKEKPKYNELEHEMEMERVLKIYKWLDDARSYILNHKRLSKGNKLFYLNLLQNTNLEAWKDYIDDNYSPSEAVEEDMTYAD